jgi:hypothetical protein
MCVPRHPNRSTAVHGHHHQHLHISFCWTKTYAQLLYVRFWRENPTHPNLKTSEYKFHYTRLLEIHSKAMLFKTAVMYTASNPVSV